MIALVFGVIAASIMSGQMHLVFGQQSTNTAVAPAIQMASAVAKNVFGCVITSSPGPIPSAIRRQPDGVGPVAHADRVLRAVILGQLRLELLQHRSHHIGAALQHLLDVGVNFLLDVVVLPNVAVEFNFHKCPNSLAIPPPQ